MRVSGVLAVLGLVSPVVLGDVVASDSSKATKVSDYSSVLETNFCKMDKDEMIGPNCEVTFKEINDINQNIRKNVIDLVNTDFFKYFKIDLYKQCPFWDDNNAYCVNRACAVDIVEDWDTLPEYWQPDVLGSLSNGTTVEDTDDDDDEFTFLDQLCAGNNKQKFMAGGDVNYCDMEDFSKEGSVLVDLSANPERFTGYGGEQSGQIWSSIYRENCFTLNETGQSIAKDVFFRLVSGLHASIGTHLSNEHLNVETGKWEPDLDLFMARVGNFPERVSNMYFNYALVSKALWKIKPYLNHLEFCSSYDEDVKDKIINIISQLDSKIFNEDLVFEDDLSSKLKDDFRVRFKNVTKIMDCVHCDRCRLWGKVQTTGYATSLKILFELDEGDEQTKQHIVDKLTKYELIALFNTLDRLSKSIESVNNFERLYNEKLKSKDTGTLASFFQNNNFFKLLGKASKCITESVQEVNKSLNNSIQKRNEPSSKINKKQEKQFSDLKMPEKKPQQKSNQQVENVWKKAWNNEIHNLKEAFTFIYRSYLDLPRNIFKLTLSTVARLWNRFIGVKDYLRESDKDISYEINLQ
ncbi:hypothetical protein Kpol_309p9 [Vanderwaltozyma polyspora DSM 70294]|uniref:Endoplasmic oxidoreductin-1 n=1 Tax=Vanderwaltozyma polyspora (strain ATCC 22028 / DSM 70294 / BCRC 21397 / CBS 2163 / NBRC 10782 / NRRL Y-8283 / UCD 57-17) TaxID=436907 RepID=A7TSX4_VANPO|nr:uncharacterized protein Kpol_309p9 [Vanderwaltozyma polyspora DSM 70294]EDO14640.1 hypothetical protein Kpol_309p9 [Vanderwaltozyma polyspora DSM 70294]